MVPEASLTLRLSYQQALIILLLDKEAQALQPQVLLGNQVDINSAFLL